MPAAAFLLTDKENSSARSFSVSAVYLRMLSGLIMRTYSAPAKRRFRHHVRLVASALPPGAALRRHLYLGPSLGLSPLEPGN